MLGESLVHKFSQLAYLDMPGGMRAGKPTVGAVADFYTADPVGRAYLKTRFGSIAAEYASWKQFLQSGLADVRDFQIVDQMDDNSPDGTGLYACTYRSAGGETVAAFRGSEMLGNRRYRNDYETDFALSYDKQTPQQQKAEQYLRESAALRGPFWLTGHSLGGNLALYAAVRAPRQAHLQACYAFNAPGFGSDMIAENKRRIDAVRHRLHLIQNEHDIVSSLLLDLCEPVVVESLVHPAARANPTVEEMLYPHSNFVYRQQDGAFVRVQGGQKDALCKGINRFTKLFLRLPSPVKKAVGDMLLDAIYLSQPPAKQLEFFLERVTKYMVRQGVDRQQLELGAGLFWARQMAGDAHAAESYRRLHAGDLDARQELAEAAVLLFQLLREGCAGPGCSRRSSGRSA